MRQWLRRLFSRRSRKVTIVEGARERSIMLSSTLTEPLLIYWNGRWFRVDPLEEARHG